MCILDANVMGLFWAVLGLFIFEGTRYISAADFLGAAFLQVVENVRKCNLCRLLLL